jgi:hypothetical protein
LPPFSVEDPETVILSEVVPGNDKVRTRRGNRNSYILRRPCFSRLVWLFGVPVRYHTRRAGVCVLGGLPAAHS